MADATNSTPGRVCTGLASLTIEDYRSLVRQTPLASMRIVQVSDEWCVILDRGRPAFAIPARHLAPGVVEAKKEKGNMMKDGA